MAYNGWTNYETWNVALWIDNDQGSYSYRCEMAQECYDDNKDDADDAKRALASRLKDYIEEMNPLASDASLFSDLLGAALSEVDWYEIAENFLEDVDKDDDDTESADTDDKPQEPNSEEPVTV